jgi:molecular chaperone GrpE
MANEHNRYREEENELNEEVAQNEVTLEEEKVETVDANESNKKEKKNKKNKKVEDFEEYHLLVQEVANLKDDLLRNRADLENFKRRNNEERIRERKYALQDFLMELIDVIDIYDKAVSVKTEDEKLNKFLSGFIMINNRLKQILEHYEVRQIDALNKPFDPSFHSAIETVKVDGVEPNTVVEVVITGYTYKDRVLRPSMVKVSE